MPEGYRVNPKKDRDGLTAKQKDFVEAALEVGPTKAAEIAYPEASSDSHRKIASENLKNPNIVSNISKLADAKGLTKDACVEAIKDGLTATKLYGKEGIEHEDSPARLRAAELGLKLHGELKESSTTINFLTPESFDLFIRKLNDNPA